MVSRSLKNIWMLFQSFPAYWQLRAWWSSSNSSSSVGAHSIASTCSLHGGCVAFKSSGPASTGDEFWDEQYQELCEDYGWTPDVGVNKEQFIDTCHTWCTSLKGNNMSMRKSEKHDHKDTTIFLFLWPSSILFSQPRYSSKGSIFFLAVCSTEDFIGDESNSTDEELRCPGRTSVLKRFSIRIVVSSIVWSNSSPEQIVVVVPLDNNFYAASEFEEQ